MTDEAAIKRAMEALRNTVLPPKSRGATFEDVLELMGADVDAALRIVAVNVIETVKKHTAH